MKRYSEFLSPERFCIFLFHGVITFNKWRVRNYKRKHLERNYFIRILDDLAERGQAVTMEAIVAQKERGEKLPPYSFAISFDDGFLNNLTIAAPLLKERNMPAIFYLTTQFVNDNKMSWIDTIESAVELSKGFDSASLAPVPSRWCETDQDKRWFLDQIRFWIKNSVSANALELSEEIRRQLHPQPLTLDPELDTKMTWLEVNQLIQDPLFIIGGHSHTHRILTFLSPPELEWEIATSLSLLENKTGLRPRHYSYPEGLSHCYSEQVIETLRRHGIVCCPTAEDGTNDKDTDLYRLKRITVV